MFPPSPKKTRSNKTWSLLSNSSFGSLPVQKLLFLPPKVVISFVQIMIRGQLSSGQNLKEKILLDGTSKQTFNYLKSDEKHPRYSIHCTNGGVGLIL